MTGSPSPDMRPIILPEYVQAVDNDIRKYFSSFTIISTTFYLFKSGRSFTRIGWYLSDLWTITWCPRFTTSREHGLNRRYDVRNYTPLTSPLTTNLASQSEEYGNAMDDGYSPHSPVDEMMANIHDERRYRLSLTHDYHPSRMLIWQVVLESSYLRCFFSYTTALGPFSCWNWCYWIPVQTTGPVRDTIQCVHTRQSKWSWNSISSLYSWIRTGAAWNIPTG